MFVDSETDVELIAPIEDDSDEESQVSLIFDCS